jgi:phage tail-like protein
MASDAALISWLRSGDARMLQVLLCNADGQPALVWQAARAVPVKLTGSSLDASSNEVFMDCLELQAAGWSIKSSA